MAHGKIQHQHIHQSPQEQINSLGHTCWWHFQKLLPSPNLLPSHTNTTNTPLKQTLSLKTSNQLFAIIWRPKTTPSKQTTPPSKHLPTTFNLLATQYFYSLGSQDVSFFWFWEILQEYCLPSEWLKTET